MEVVTNARFGIAICKALGIEYVGKAIVGAHIDSSESVVVANVRFAISRETVEKIAAALGENTAFSTGDADPIPFDPGARRHIVELTELANNAGFSGRKESK